MEITINQVEEFIVVPEEFMGEDAPPKFIFRTPNTIDYMDFHFFGKHINEITANCFLRFENKIIIKNEKNEQVNYKDYRDFTTKFCASPQIATIAIACAARTLEKINDVQVKADETLKKSELVGNSGTAEKQPTKKGTPKTKRS